MRDKSENVWTRPGVQPELANESSYQAERAICDKAAAYWEANATHGRNGSSMSAELASHPDYSACTNEIRGRVDQWETLQNPPADFVAYIGSDDSGPLVTVWTGLPLGRAYVKSRSRVGFVTLFSYGARIAGREYYGRGQGEGMAIRLRETAASRKARESGK